MPSLHKFFYFSCVGIFLLIFLDTFILPPQHRKDAIDFFGSKTSYMSRSHWTITSLYTKSGYKIPLPEKYNYDFDDTCALIVHIGLIFRLPVSVDITSSGQVYSYQTSLVTRTGGASLIAMITAVLFLVSIMQLLFWKKRNSVLLAFCFFTGYFCMELILSILRQ